MLGTFGVVLLFLCCWAVYDPSVRRSFGLRQEYVAQILSSYAPLVGATLLGFRDVLFGGISIGASKRTSIPISQGGGILYGIAFLGIGSAAAALIFVSTDPPKIQAQWLIGGVATL
ncbi:MAG: hypothetical protein MJE77_01210 [Proteobacteria bacterium]|nr:hypothetical protein [Pseudomonadota bacterium]